MASTVRENDIKKLREAGYQPSPPNDGTDRPYSGTPQEVFQRCLDPEQEANGWPLPSERRISKTFGRPGIWPRKSATVSRRRDRSSLLRNPMRGLYSSLTLSVG